MAKMQVLEPGFGDTESLIDEYKQRLAHVLEGERIRLKELAEHESEQMRARASREASAIVEAARQEADRIIAEAGKRAEDESVRNLIQAQQRADKIISDAEGRAEDRAKEKTRQDVQRIIARAREEAEKSVALAKQAAADESDRIMAKAREQAEELAAEAKETAFAHAQEESARIIAEAEGRANAITAGAVERAAGQVEKQLGLVVAKVKGRLHTESTYLLAEVSGRLEKLFDESEAEMERECEGLAKAVSEAERQSVVALDNEAGLGAEHTGEGAAAAAPVGEETQAIDDAGAEASAPVDEVNYDRRYKGRLDLEFGTPFDQAQLESLRECLSRVAGLKLLSAGGSANGEIVQAVYTIDIKQPLQLLRLLKEMPPVESVAQRKRNIGITLRRSEERTYPYD